MNISELSWPRCKSYKVLGRWADKGEPNHVMGQATPSRLSKSRWVRVYPSLPARTCPLSNFITKKVSNPTANNTTRSSGTSKRYLLGWVIGIDDEWWLVGKWEGGRECRQLLIHTLVRRKNGGHPWRSFLPFFFLFFPPESDGIHLIQIRGQTNLLKRKWNSYDHKLFSIYETKPDGVDRAWFHSPSISILFCRVIKGTNYHLPYI